MATLYFFFNVMKGACLLHPAITIVTIVLGYCAGPLWGWLAFGCLMWMTLGEI